MTNNLELNTSREPEPGHSCMHAGPALRNFAGEHFPLLTSRPCAFNLFVVLRFGFDGHHARILTLQGFDHHFSGSVHQFFWVLAACKLLWLHWVLALVWDTLGLQAFCTQIILAVQLRLATLWQSLFMSICHMHPHAHWPSLGLLLPLWHEPLPQSARVAGYPSQLPWPVLPGVLIALAFPHQLRLRAQVPGGHLRFWPWSYVNRHRQSNIT